MLTINVKLSQSILHHFKVPVVTLEFYKLGLRSHDFINISEGCRGVMDRVLAGELGALNHSLSSASGYLCDLE